MDKQWTHLDTFSGIGGFALAAAWTGRIRTVQFVEIDPWCRRVLAKHWPGVPIERDIRTLVGYGRVDLITGGFPCQPWSAAGKQRGIDDHRDLWPELARTIRVLRPRWVLAENVAGIVNMENGLTRVLADLGAAGYEARAYVIPAAAVGAYHRRDRVWIVAHAAGADGNGAIADRHARGRRGPSDGGAVRDADGQQQGAFGGVCGGAHTQSARDRETSGQDASHPDGAGRGEHGRSLDVRAQLTPAERGRSERHAGHEALSRLGDAPDGVSRWLDGPLAFGPDWEVGIPRVTQHEVDRVNKLKALGNSIVPQVAYELLRMMLEVDDA